MGSICLVDESRCAEVARLSLQIQNSEYLCLQSLAALAWRQTPGEKSHILAELFA